MTSQLDADGLDIVDAIVADATAVEGVANVHEGSGYFAERVIRRAIAQGTLIAVGPENHPAHRSPLAALRQITEHSIGDDLGMSECPNCHDKGFDHYWTIKRIAREALK